MNVVRIWTIAANGFRDVIRDRIFYIIGFFTLVLIIALRLLPEVALSADKKIFLDFGLGAIGFLSALVAIFVGTGLVNKEIEKRTVLVLIPKPLTRAELIVGKHLGLVAVLATLVAVMTAIYLSLLGLSQIYYPTGTILISLLYLLIELGLIIAVALMFGVLTSSILGTLLTFGVYLMGHFSQDLVELSKITENPGIELLTQALYLIIPDLSRLNLRDEAVYGLLPAPVTLWSNALYGIIYTVLLLAITI
ncbi:MAG: ABC transporter permease, partial [Spirulinaceae cyanobacterium]